MDFENQDETPRFSPDIQAINFFQYFLTAKVAFFMILRPVFDRNISPHSQCSVFGWVAKFAKTRQLYVSLSGCVGQPAGVWLGRHENRGRVLLCSGRRASRPRLPQDSLRFTARVFAAAMLSLLQSNTMGASRHAADGRQRPGTPLHPVGEDCCTSQHVPLLGFCCRIYVESYRPLFASSAVSNKCRN